MRDGEDEVEYEVRMEVAFDAGFEEGLCSGSPFGAVDAPDDLDSDEKQAWLRGYDQGVFRSHH